MKTLVLILVAVGLSFGALVYGAEKAKSKKDTAKTADSAVKQSDKKDEPKAVVQEKEKAPEQPVVVDPEKTVVKVNGKVIKEGQVFKAVEKRLAAQLKNWGQEEDRPQEMINSLKEQLRTDVVNMLVDEAIIDEQLKAKKIDVTDEQAKERIKEMAAERKQTLEDVEKEIVVYGMTMADLQGQIRKQIAVEQLVDLETKGQGDVSEQDAKDFYDANPQFFSQPEMVRASHILIKTEGLDEAGKAAAKKKLEGILKEVKDGKDFAELAKANSDCPSKDRGGDLDFFKREQMVKPFSDTAFALKAGQVSDIVETQFGYHIIKATDHKDAKTEKFDEVKVKIETYLKNNKRIKFWKEYMQGLKDKSKIEWSVEEQALRDKQKDVTVKP